MATGTVNDCSQQAGTSGGQFYYCECFLCHNYFLPELRRHVNLPHELELTASCVEQFLMKICQEDGAGGCCGADAIRRSAAELLAERRRRECEDELSGAREASISAGYVYKSGHAFCVDSCTSVLDPRFVALVEAISISASDDNATPPVRVEDFSQFGLEHALEPDQQVFALPIFTDAFCDAFLAELANFRSAASADASLTCGRPNTMNREGLLLDELRPIRAWLDHLRLRYLQPLIWRLFGQSRRLLRLDSHRAFTVLYRPGRDTGLGYHYDNSEYTLNACLSDEASFHGNELFFGRLADASARSRLASGAELAVGGFPAVRQRRGWGLLHRGLHMHGVRSLAGGRRENLVLWLRASALRNRLCPRCWRPPRRLPSCRYGDGMTDGDDSPAD